MIALLTGRVVARGTDSCILDVGGVGFRVMMSTASLSALPSEGDEVTVHTHLHVREDDLSLFGFESPAEKSAFESLITVSGVGPKVALAALSTFSPGDLARVVAAGDVAAVSTIPGVGRKTAQRIILDLADRLEPHGDGGEGPHADGAAVAEASEALMAMGFTPAEAAVALGGFDGDPSDAQALITHALKRLGSSR